MPFRNVAQLADAEATQGRLWRQMVYKTATPATAALQWGDCSIGAGLPNYNAYVGSQYEFTALTGTGNRSIYTGPGIGATQTRHVGSVMAQTSVNVAPAFLLFADYLGFYPLLDCDSTDAQALVNVSALPRYSDGDGVMACLVVQVPQTNAALANCTLSYTNHAGVSGRTTTFGVYGSNVIGALCNQGNPTNVNGLQAMAPVVPLQSGDRGVRSVQSVTFSAGIGGFVNLLLFRPLFDITLHVLNVPAEKHLLRHNAKLPQVLDGAFLQCLAVKQQAGSMPLMAQLDFNWS